ncbi:MAG TPA: dihydrolipoyl dehydrogenase [bacterium]|nr:dihydrolipoyl dehydrogenase [bacterium]HPQ19365.1 dihydrolipoyl dehydrogenase [bacterium]
MLISKEYDIAIIGSGPAGITAALNFAKNNFKTLLIEKNEIGGVCLNQGCIPTKTLLFSAELFKKFQKANEFGININGPINFDYKKIIDRKNKIIEINKNNLIRTLTQNKIEIRKGIASFIENNKLKIRNGAKEEFIQAEKIIIATGAKPRILNLINFDHKYILDSTDFLNLSELPDSCIILGAGYIGCEFASLLSLFNKKVYLLEARKSILPDADNEIIDTLTKEFKRNGIEIKTNIEIKNVQIENNQVLVQLNNNEIIRSNKMLVAIGVMPQFDLLNLDMIKMKREENQIIINSSFETNIENIYAIGDVISKIKLANVSAMQANYLINKIVNKKEMEFNYYAVPNCIFSNPQIGYVGLTEKEAQNRSLDYAIGRCLYRQLAKSHINGEINGFVKILICKNTKKILGAHIIGDNATELIHQFCLAMKNNLSINEFISFVRGHPLYSEILLEAAISVS